jgi:hypothetical protein
MERAVTTDPLNDVQDAPLAITSKILISCERLPLPRGSA